MIRLYADAAVNGNPGQAGLGILIITEKDQYQLTPTLPGMWNNHHAEFQAISHGLSWLVEKDLTGEMTFCYTDSQIVAQSVEKEYVKDKTSQIYLEKILDLMDEFSYVSVTWIPELENRGADNLARQALQKAINNQK
jgi:ribonuclease HI